MTSALDGDRTRDLGAQNGHCQRERKWHLSRIFDGLRAPRDAGQAEDGYDGQCKMAPPRDPPPPHTGKGPSAAEPPHSEPAHAQGRAFPVVLAVLAVAVAVASPVVVPTLRDRLAAHRPCALGDICLPGQQRPRLPDGRVSREIWDMARHHVRTNFSRAVRHLANPRASVSYLSEEPVVVYFDGVLEEEEIDLLIEGASPRFERSRVVGPDGGHVNDESRTSSTAFLYERDDPRHRTIKEKVTGLIGFVADQSEDISVRTSLHYALSPTRAEVLATRGG
jgi:hypothetical protein